MRAAIAILLVALSTAAPAALAMGDKPNEEKASGGCIVGGCSGQLCSEATQGPMMSTCEWREEYACYKQSQCERQPNGQCGWTPNQAFTECLGSSGAAAK